MKIRHLISSASALLLASTIPVSAIAMEDWQFEDSIGTALPDLLNSAGTAAFTAASQVATDGSGNLRFTQGADGTDNVFRNATLTSPNQSTGQFEMSFVYTSADLSTGDAAGANVAFGMRDDSNTDLFLVRLQKQNDTLRLQHRVGSTNTDLENFGVTSLSDLQVRVVADLDSDTFDIFWSLGTGAVKCSTNIPMSATGLELDKVRLTSNTNTNDWGSTDQVDVGFLTLSTHTEIVSPAIEDWPLNDLAGASLNDAVNVVGTANLGAAAANVLTDGLGSLVFSQGVDGSDSVFRNATISNPDQSSGQFELEYLISSANVLGVPVDGIATGANVGFGMRDSVVGSDLFLVRLQLQNNTLRLQTRVGTTTTTLENFGVTSLSDLAVRTVADLDTDTFSVYWQLGTGVGNCVTDIPMLAPDMEFDILRIAATTKTTTWGAADEIKVDSLVVRDLNPATDLSLAIEKGPTAGQVTLIWPTASPASTVLKSSPDLQSPWTAVPGTPTIVDDNYQLVVSTGAGFLGFRLEAP